MSSQIQIFRPRTSERPRWSWGKASSPGAPVAPPTSRRLFAQGGRSSSTLITGQRDAVLVDNFITEEGGNRAGDRVETERQSLKTIDITHWHAPPLRPGALLEWFRRRGIATPSVIPW